MPLVAGTVTVKEDGTVTFNPGAGANLAKEIYTEFVNNYSADASMDSKTYDFPGGKNGAAVRHGYATLATRLAAAIVAHIVTNGEVTVTVDDAGLQRDNTVGNPATLAPAAPVVLATKGTIA